MKVEECILFSGGAGGAEAEFGADAERLGLEEVNFSFEGHNHVRERGLRILNHDELLSGDVSLAYVSKLMNRRYSEGPAFRKVLQTIWHQINHGQEIFVIGEILDDGTVKGGTRWGAEFARSATSPCMCSTKRVRPGTDGRARRGRRSGEAKNRVSSTSILREQAVGISPMPERRPFAHCTTGPSAEPVEPLDTSMRRHPLRVTPHYFIPIPTVLRSCGYTVGASATATVRHGDNASW